MKFASSHLPSPAREPRLGENHYAFAAAVRPSASPSLGFDSRRGSARLGGFSRLLPLLIVVIVFQQLELAPLIIQSREAAGPTVASSVRPSDRLSVCLFVRPSVRPSLRPAHSVARPLRLHSSATIEEKTTYCLLCHNSLPDAPGRPSSSDSSEPAQEVAAEEDDDEHGANNMGQ